MALLILEENFELSENLDVICLPEAENIDDFTAENCVSGGFQKNFFDFTSILDKLSMFKIQYMPLDDCQNVINNWSGWLTVFFAIF